MMNPNEIARKQKRLAELKLQKEILDLQAKITATRNAPAPPGPVAVAHHALTKPTFVANKTVSAATSMHKPASTNNIHGGPTSYGPSYQKPTASSNHGSVQPSWKKSTVISTAPATSKYEAPNGNAPKWQKRDDSWRNRSDPTTPTTSTSSPRHSSPARRPSSPQRFRSPQRSTSPRRGQKDEPQKKQLDEFRTVMLHLKGEINLLRDDFKKSVEKPASEYKAEVMALKGELIALKSQLSRNQTQSIRMIKELQNDMPKLLQNPNNESDLQTLEKQLAEQSKARLDPVKVELIALKKEVKQNQDFVSSEVEVLRDKLLDQKRQRDATELDTLRSELQELARGDLEHVSAEITASIMAKVSQDAQDRFERAELATNMLTQNQERFERELTERMETKFSGSAQLTHSDPTPPTDLKDLEDRLHRVFVANMSEQAKLLEEQYSKKIKQLESKLLQRVDNPSVNTDMQTTIDTAELEQNVIGASREQVEAVVQARLRELDLEQAEKRIFDKLEASRKTTEVVMQKKLENLCADVHDEQRRYRFEVNQFKAKIMDLTAQLERQQQQHQEDIEVLNAKLSNRSASDLTQAHSVPSALNDCASIATNMSDSMSRICGVVISQSMQESLSVASNGAADRKPKSPTRKPSNNATLDNDTMSVPGLEDGPEKEDSKFQLQLTPSPTKKPPPSSNGVEMPRPPDVPDIEHEQPVSHESSNQSSELMFHVSVSETSDSDANTSLMSENMSPVNRHATRTLSIVPEAANKDSLQNDLESSQNSPTSQVDKGDDESDVAKHAGSNESKNGDNHDTGSETSNGFCSNFNVSSQSTEPSTDSCVAEMNEASSESIYTSGSERLVISVGGDHGSDTKGSASGPCSSSAYTDDATSTSEEETSVDTSSSDSNQMIDETSIPQVAAETDTSDSESSSTSSGVDTNDVSAPSSLILLTEVNKMHSESTSDVDSSSDESVSDGDVKAITPAPEYSMASKDSTSDHSTSNDSDTDEMRATSECAIVNTEDTELPLELASLERTQNGQVGIEECEIVDESEAGMESVELNAEPSASDDSEGSSPGPGSVRETSRNDHDSDQDDDSEDDDSLMPDISQLTNMMTKTLSGSGSAFFSGLVPDTSSLTKLVSDVATLVGPEEQDDDVDEVPRQEVGCVDDEESSVDVHTVSNDEHGKLLSPSGLLEDSNDCIELPNQYEMSESSHDVNESERTGSSESSCTSESSTCVSEDEVAGRVSQPTKYLGVEKPDSREADSSEEEEESDEEETSDGDDDSSVEESDGGLVSADKLKIDDANELDLRKRALALLGVGVSDLQEKEDQNVSGESSSDDDSETEIEDTKPATRKTGVLRASSFDDPDFRWPARRQNKRQFKKSLSFDETPEVKEIPKLSVAEKVDLFYDKHDIRQFREEDRRKKEKKAMKAAMKLTTAIDSLPSFWG